MTKKQKQGIQGQVLDLSFLFVPSLKLSVGFTDMEKQAITHMPKPPN